MKTIARGLVLILSLFNLVIGLGFLLQPAKLAAAFFIGASLFALYGAWKMRADALLVPMVMIGLALTGRFVSLALDGMAPTAPAPMVIEVIMLTILFVGYRAFQPAGKSA